MCLFPALAQHFAMVSLLPQKEQGRHLVLTMTVVSLVAPKLIAVTLSLLPRSITHSPHTHTHAGSTHKPVHKYKHQATYVGYGESSAWRLRRTIKQAL